MGFELSYKGKKVDLHLKGEKSSPKELKSLLDTIHKVELQLTESQLRDKVVKQLKNELLDDGIEDSISHWWDLPQDLLKKKSSTKFIAKESDLNPALHYDKASFSLKVVIDNQGKHYAFDREQLMHAIQKLGLGDRLKKTSSLLIRLKGNFSQELKDEVNDFLRNHLNIERMHVVYDSRSYDERVSMDIILFGDFIIEQQ